MPRPRTVLFGSTGQIGCELRQLLGSDHELLCPSEQDCNFLSPDSITAYLAGSQPDLIVNAAAWTDVDGAETHRDQAQLVNAESPARMAAHAAKHGARLVHFSTDYVYSGQGETPHLESEPIAPLNHYGLTKAAGDRAIQKSGCPHLILRISWVYGLTGKNFLRTMLRLGTERDELSVVSDQMGAPSWSRFLAQNTTRATGRLATASPAEAKDLSGVYHLAPAGVTSWHGFATRIFELAAGRIPLQVRTVRAISSAEFPSRAVRPRNSALDTTRFEKTFGLERVPWEALLEQCLSEMA